MRLTLTSHAEQWRRSEEALQAANCPRGQALRDQRHIARSSVPRTNTELVPARACARARIHGRSSTISTAPLDPPERVPSHAVSDEDAVLATVFRTKDSPAVSCSALLDQVTAFTRRFVVLDDPQLVAAALWVLHTHAFEAAEFTPYLAVTSAEKRCGKTTLLETLVQLAARPRKAGSMTVGVLKRVVEEHPTLFIDEADAAFGGNKEYSEALRGVLNEGFQISGTVAFCIPSGGDKGWETAFVSVFCPKAIAAINTLPDTVLDRSIELRLKRRLRTEDVEKFRRRNVTAASEPIRAALEQWTASAVPQLQDMDHPTMPETLGDRSADVWEPLLTIADLAGGPWPERARDAAVALSATTELEAESIGTQLLRNIRSVWSGDQMPSRDLVAQLVELETGPWGAPHPDWGRELTPIALAKLLKPYGVRPRSIRISRRENPNGYRWVDLNEAWQRYLPEAADTADSPDNVRYAGAVAGVPPLSSSSGVSGPPELEELL